MRRSLVTLVVAMAGLLGAALPQVAAAAGGPAPGSPAFIQRDNQNQADAHGRQTAPDGQLRNPNYLPAAVAAGNEVGLAQLAQQAANPTRPAISPGNVFPGWNMGNPYRRGWSGRRGMSVAVSWTNRYGALIRGDVFAPLPGARDPYTHKRLRRPYPGVVITTGSVQGSEGMYKWLAEDLAERGYVVLTYDVQGQGTSETFPHENDQLSALPFCNPFAPPRAVEQFGCPGVPAQQPSNFIFGTRDALSFFLSTPSKRYHNKNAGGAQVNSFNPYWRLFNRSKDKRSVTRGRGTRVAIIGHSLGAAAVSYVQGVDRRVETAVALDKLTSGGSQPPGNGLPPVKPVVPSLAIQSEYGFTVNPYWANNKSSLNPQPGPPTQGPDPRREEKTGFDAWRKTKVDTMLIVPRASTHLEYTDIAYALPASRYGQDLTSVYVQAWLDRYLRHRNPPLLGTNFRYLEPVAPGTWKPVKLRRKDRLSFYYCSGYSLRKPGSKRTSVSRDIAGVGGC